MQQPSTSLRRRLSALFDDDAPQTRTTRIFNALLAALIIVNVAAVILESVEPIRAHNARLFTLIETCATTIFAIEYVLRLWTSVDFRSGRFHSPLWGRLTYARGFFPLIDLIAVLPAVLGLIGAGDLRVLRLLRLLRMIKLTRHSTTFALLWAVLREEAQAIGALIFVLVLTLTIGGALMYMLEGAAQPNVFTSIPAAMWWAIETITTVGYGDIVPVTLAGRILGGIISVMGIGALALFSGLITAGYLNQLRLRREQRAKIHTIISADFGARHHAHIAHAVCPHCGGILPGARIDGAAEAQ
ncbi:MAG TPA: ion transporter [Methylovirgula sp.]|nr:ion transporter [Methylovirgula sp.]